jgi:polypeptide N-acetylgalactosaminyltransferase
MNTWEYRRVYGDADKHFRGIFEWGLLYKETEISPEEKSRRKHNSEPFRSPTHAGGLFAIDKKWFEELGYYDPGLQIWGTFLLVKSKLFVIFRRRTIRTLGMFYRVIILK